MGIIPTYKTQAVIAEERELEFSLYSFFSMCVLSNYRVFVGKQSGEHFWEICTLGESYLNQHFS